MVKKILVFFMIFASVTLFADYIDNCDDLILMDKYEDAIDLIDKKIIDVESPVIKAQLQIRKYYSEVELNKFSATDEELNALYEVGKNSYDFRLVLAAFYFARSKYATSDEDQKLFAENGEKNIRVSANIFPNNKKYFIYSAKIFSDTINKNKKTVYYNPSYSISLLRKYFMLDKTDFIGYCLMIKSLQERNWDLQERIAGINTINQKLRRLSDPIDKNRYLEGFKNFASFYEYAPGKQFLSISDNEEASFISKYISKFKLTEEERNYYTKNFGDKNNKTDYS